MLKANPYADTYRMAESELDEYDRDESEGDSGEGYSRLQHEDGLLELDRRLSDEVDRQLGNTLKSDGKGKERQLEQTPASTSTREDTSDSTAAPGDTRIINLGDQKIYIRKGGLHVRFGDKRHPISYFRLRDACPCPRCIDPSTRQKTHTSPEAFREISQSIFANTVPSASRIRHDSMGTVEGLRIEWTADHSAFISKDRLLALTSPHFAPSQRIIARRQFWDRQVLLKEDRDLHVRYAALARGQNEGDFTLLLKTLQQLQKFGLVVIKGVPTDTSGNADASLRQVMGWIGEIRNTFYGETWNVKNIANSKNVAYTNLNLGLHMDLL